MNGRASHGIALPFQAHPDRTRTVEVTESVIPVPAPSFSCACVNLSSEQVRSSGLGRIGSRLDSTGHWFKRRMTHVR